MTDRPVTSVYDLAAQGLHVFPADHPGHPECIGRHGPDSPCDGTRGKHPAVKWGVWAVTVTPQMIDLEWGKHGGLANPAVACGPSNIVILDEDQVGELDRWCAAYGIALPDTYTVSTGRGRHLYFRWDHTKQRIGNSAKAMDGFKIDVRGDGGYAIAEGSQHESGVIYTGNGRPIADLTGPLAALLLAGAANGQQPEDAGPLGEHRDGRDYDNDKIGFHKRHHALVAYAGRLRKSGLSLAEALPAFRQRWLLCEQPEGQIPEARYHSPDCPYPVTWEDAQAKLRDVYGRYPGGRLGGDNYADPEDTGSAAGPVERLDIEHLEQDFWNRRESLRTIFDGALARMCSPWAVLAYCAARALALAKPRLRLPALIGGPGSLNWFAAVAARSGGGKGSAARVARELVAEPVLTRNLGSGEGLVDAYIKTPGTAKTEPELYDSVMFVADEIDTLAALSARTGTTLPSMLRSAFTGDTLGFSNRKASSLHLREDTYRLTLVVNVQPGRAGALVDDAYGGMLQRFMWFPGVDARISAECGDFPGRLTMPPWAGCWKTGCGLEVPVEAERLIREERAKSQRGEHDHLDTHALFVREKFAYALAILDGRDKMTGEDWELSGVAAAVSECVRGWVSAELERARDEEAAQRGALQGVSQAAAGVSKARAEPQRSNRIAVWIIDRLKAAGRGGMSEGELRRDADSSIRHSIVPVLGVLAEQGRVEKIARVKGDRSDRWVLV
jgi:Bifunctional DNA primase/polymerase, N-terminal